MKEEMLQKNEREKEKRLRAHHQASQF